MKVFKEPALRSLRKVTTLISQLESNTRFLNFAVKPIDHAYYDTKVSEHQAKEIMFTSTIEIERVVYSILLDLSCVNENVYSQCKLYIVRHAFIESEFANTNEDVNAFARCEQAFTSSSTRGVNKTCRFTVYNKSRFS